MGRTGKVVGGVVGVVALAAAAVFWVQPGWFGLADPLIGRDAGGELCIPVRGDGTVTLGGQEFDNTTERDVTVDRVTLQGARGVRLVHAFLVPHTNDPLLGARSGYPPAEEDLPTGWARRVPLLGTGFAPGIDTEIALVLVPTGPDRTWSIDGYTVDYRSAVRHWHGTVDLEVRTVEGACP